MQVKWFINTIKTLAVCGAIALFVMPNKVEAQRPSLGGLQLQINRMLSGEEDFENLSIPGGMIRFGDGCTIGIDPDFAGLTESDPAGFRLLGQNLEGCILRFGPTDDCSIGIDPTREGMVFSDRGCFIFENPDPNGVPEVRMDSGQLLFGDECFLGIVPGLTGMTESDPGGLRLLGRDNQGCLLTFGPTDDCTIGIDPEREGMVFRDIGCFIFETPDPTIPAELNIDQGTVRFGDLCSLGVDPQFTGLVESDPGGLRLLGQGGEGCILTFGPSDDCRIFIDPQREGLIFRDIGCFVFETPNPNVPAVLDIDQGTVRFGDECSLGVDPRFTGLVESDPGGLRLLGREGLGCLLTFGPSDDCRILVDPTRTNEGITISDPQPIVFRNPKAQGSANVVVEGTVFAQEFAQSSRRDLKKNIETIKNPIETVKKLRGVSFDWKAAGNSEIGFIADEVAEVVAEAAVYNEKDEAQGVKYSNLVALVVESVKAQQTQIESQQRLIEELQEELAQMRISEQ